MNKKQNFGRLTTLAGYLEEEVKRKEALQQYYQRILGEMKMYREKLHHLGEVKDKEKRKESSASSRFVEQFERKSGMNNSRISDKSGAPKLDRSKMMSQTFSGKLAESLSYQAEYREHAEGIGRVISSLLNKEQNSQNKKEAQRTNKSVSFKNRSMKGSLILDSKPDMKGSLMLKTSTERVGVELTKPEKMLNDLGDASLLSSEDEIVNNLLKNLRMQQQRYVNNLMAETELMMKQRMKHYMLRQCEKYEQMIFKFKQEEAKEAEASISSNRQIVRGGYTERMKELVQRGLRLRGF